MTEIQYRQRPAWQVRVPTGNPGEERLIVVDRETGIPVRSALFRNGVAGAEWRIDQLRVNGPADESFRQTPSSGQTPMRYDMGFRRVELEDVADRVGYRALVPEWLPDGFERGEVAVADRARPTGGEAHRNPESREVVSLRYRRGLDELVVTTRRAIPAPSAWQDPVLGSAPMGRAPERVTFRDGALEGRAGEVVVDANSVPHVWALAGPWWSRSRATWTETSWYASPSRSSRRAEPLYTGRKGPLAQLVEQGTFNPKVAGSSPARPTRQSPWKAPLSDDADGTWRRRAQAPVTTL